MGKKKADLFDDIIDKISNMINKWYNRFLSYAGGALLIQTLTNTIPSYAMNITQLPASCIQRINSLNKKFLWNPSSISKNAHKVNWNNVYSQNIRVV